MLSQRPIPQGVLEPTGHSREEGWLGLALPALVPSPGSWAHTRMGPRARGSASPHAPQQAGKGKQQREAMVLGGLAGEHGGCDREHRGGGAPALAGPPFSGLASPPLTLVGPPGMHALPFLGASIPNNQYSLGINEGALAFHAGEERHLLQRPKQLPGLPLLGEGAPHGTRDNAGWRKGSANPVKALG